MCFQYLRKILFYWKTCRLLDVNVHGESCRAVRFTSDGKGSCFGTSAIVYVIIVRGGIRKAVKMLDLIC